MVAVATILVTSDLDEVEVGINGVVLVGVTTSEVVVRGRELVGTEIDELVVGSVVFTGIDTDEEDVTGGGVEVGISVLLVFDGI